MTWVAMSTARRDRKKADFDKDFPIRLQKPVDTGYGPYGDGFSIELHKFGSFGLICAKVKELRKQAKGQ